MINWISYTSQNIPGNQSFELGFHPSLSDARLAFQTYCRAVGTDDCSATLYACDQTMIAQAIEFADIGCPFDYPDRIVSIGPRGGVKIERT